MACLPLIDQLKFVFGYCAQVTFQCLWGMLILVNGCSTIKKTFTIFDTLGLSHVSLASDVKLVNTLLKFELGFKPNQCNQ